MNPRPYGPEPYALPAALRLDFFKFISIFVIGQTCGQATYFERFLEKCTARIVSFVKGFRGSKKSPLRACSVAPERCMLPTELGSLSRNGKINWLEYEMKFGYKSIYSF